MQALLVVAARGEFHELDVVDAGEGDGEVAVERGGVVADVEEDFGDRGVLEDRLEGSLGGAGGGEGGAAEGVDVD